VSPEQERQRDRIRAAKAELKAALAAHVHVRSDGGCAVCETDGGWSCPDAPDGYCHYTTVLDRPTTVLLRDGTTTEIAEPMTNFWNDVCLFCGEPDERK
jgi:hypothetical protein